MYLFATTNRGYKPKLFVDINIKQALFQDQGIKLSNKRNHKDAGIQLQSTVDFPNAIIIRSITGKVLKKMISRIKY